MYPQFIKRYKVPIMSVAFVTIMLSSLIIIFILMRQQQPPKVGDSTAVSESSVAQSEVLEPVVLTEPLQNLVARDTVTPFQPVEGELKLRSVGDVLIHERVSQLANKEHPIYQAAVSRLHQAGIDWNPTEGEYDFVPSVAQVAPFTSYADVTVANLEVVAAYPQFPVSDYPNFNAPKQIISALQYAGVDIVSNGTNHTLDLSRAGALASIANLREAGMQYVGSFESEADRAIPRIIEKNGIKLGFLTYSYGTNGIPIPEGESYLINIVDLPTMLQDVAALQPQVDAVVVTLQLGPEYDTMPDDTQREVFQALSDAGVKLILGGHPHVLQPVSWINEKQTFAIYSQASFITGQERLENKQGGITEVTFKKQVDGNVTVENPKFMPLFMLGLPSEKLYETVPLADYQKYQIPEGAQWWQTLKERMQALTQDIQIVTHLDTEWTQTTQDIFR